MRYLVMKREDYMQDALSQGRNGAISDALPAPEPRGKTRKGTMMERKIRTILPPLAQETRKLPTAKTAGVPLALEKARVKMEKT